VHGIVRVLARHSFADTLPLPRIWAQALAEPVWATIDATTAEVADLAPRALLGLDLRNAAQVREFLDEWKARDIRDEVNEWYARIHGMDAVAYSNLLGTVDPDDRARLEVVWRHRDVLAAGLDMAAFDHALVVLAARSAAAAGWIGDDEAWYAMLASAREIQRAYGSWAEHARALEIGASVVAPSLQPAIASSIRRLLVAKESTWRQLPWELPLEDASAMMSATHGTAGPATVNGAQ
jgi:hypothetical protein